LEGFPIILLEEGFWTRFPTLGKGKLPFRNLTGLNRVIGIFSLGIIPTSGTLLVLIKD